MNPDRIHPPMCRRGFPRRLPVILRGVAAFAPDKERKAEMRRFTVVVLLAAFFLGQFTQRVMGQSGASVMDGVVADVSGAVIPDCVVTLTNGGTGTKLETQTNGDGVYEFPSVQPGTYVMEIAKDGFQSYRVTDLRVTVAEHAMRNAVLTLSATSTSVTVDAGGAASLEQPTFECDFKGRGFPRKPHCPLARPRLC
jgi:hypothetical protein